MAVTPSSLSVYFLFYLLVALCGHPPLKKPLTLTPGLVEIRLPLPFVRGTWNYFSSRNTITSYRIELRTDKTISVTPLYKTQQSHKMCFTNIGTINRQTQNGDNGICDVLWSIRGIFANWAEPLVTFCSAAVASWIRVAYSVQTRRMECTTVQLRTHLIKKYQSRQGLLL